MAGATRQLNRKKPAARSALSSKPLGESSHFTRAYLSGFSAPST